jgi:glycosyltransferase involved in cell wall biosynthesis
MEKTTSGLKVAYVVGGRMPTEKANGYQSSQMCQAFLENGADLRLLHPARKPQYVEGLTPETTLEGYYSLRRAIPRTQLPIVDWIHYSERIFGVGRRLLGGLASVATDCNTAFSLARRLRADGYDRVYVRSAFVLLALLPLVPRRIVFSIYFEVHSLPRSKRVRARLVRAFNRIGGVVALTGALGRALREEGVEPEKVLVEHDGVDLEGFRSDLGREEARSLLGLPPAQRIAAYVGKFHTMGEEKGIPEILRSAGAWLEEVPDLRFYFIGGPMDRMTVYEKILKAENLPRDRFVFIDRVAQPRVALFLKAADILLMPFPWTTHYAYYMSPLKLFEYMAVDRPIVATRLPSVEEVLEHDRNALLAEPGDSLSLAASIRRLLLEPEHARALARQALEDVEAYSWKRRAERILRFMENRPSGR